MDVEQLSGDRRRREARLWKDWFDSIPGIRNDFIDWLDFDPLDFNETPSAGVLANAATRTGFLSLAEYVAEKGMLNGYPAFRRGRCDLWIGDPNSNRSWVFELKQRSGRGLMRQETFEGYLNKAAADANKVATIEADRRVGALIHLGRDLATDAIERIDGYCRYCTDMSYRVGGGLFPVWLAFKLID